MSYTRTKRKMFLNLADHCHDKAIDAVSPDSAAQWIALADALLWAAEPEGDADAIARIAKEFKE